MKKSRIKTIQSSFVAGEINQTLFGRVDKELYYKGAKEIRNCYVFSQGNVKRREGLEYIDGVTNNSKAKIISFEFNNEQTYLFVFTNGQIKIYKSDILQATITNATFTDQIINNFKYTQSADTLIIVHPDINPIKINRLSDTNWNITNLSLSNIPSYLFGSATITSPSANLTLSKKSGKNVKITSNVNVFNANHVNQLIISKTGGIFIVREFINAKEVKGDVRVAFPDTDILNSGDWELETGYEPVWSVARGYPKTATFFGSRLWFGASKSRPQTIWASKIGDFFNFNLGSSEDDEAIDITIDDDRVNAINNIVAGRNLQIFTSGGEFYIPFTTGAPITPRTIQIIKTTSHGSENAKPIFIDGSSLFIEKGGRVIREFVFSELEQNFNAKNISILAPHLIRTPVNMVSNISNPYTPTSYVVSTVRTT